ncbi:hypothetical protein GQ54DRAFT_250394, partial [Martensiomyces pterosporus]
YKTELCPAFRTAGVCRNGDYCTFAHGEDDVRERPRPRNYKTKPCKNFVQTGTCPYKDKCDFLH